MQIIVRCTNCGRGYGAISKAEAQRQIDRFNSFYNTLTAAEQAFLYGGKPSSMDYYTKCGACGHTKFEEAPADYIPPGCTYGPIVWEPTNEETPPRVMSGSGFGSSCAG